MFTRFIRSIVTFVFWIQAFAAPVLLMALVALAINSSGLVIPLLSVGVIGGIFLAEYIRRKIGLDVFFGRIYGPNEMDENLKKK